MNRNITAAILIIIAVGIYFTVTSTFVDQAKEVKAYNDQLTSALDSAATIVASRDQVLKQYNDISETDRDRLDKIIPSTVDNIRLIIDLNSIAVKHGFSLANIKTAATQTTKNSASQVRAPSAPTSAGQATVTFATPVLDTVDVSFGVTATYNQFVSFLQDLESSLRIIDVTHVSVAASDTGVYAFQVQLRTYWLRQ